MLGQPAGGGARAHNKQQSGRKGNERGVGVRRPAPSHPIPSKPLNWRIKTVSEVHCWCTAPRSKSDCLIIVSGISDLRWRQ